MTIYVSIDIETTGADPAQHAILSIGASAIRVKEGQPPEALSEFYANMKVPDDRRWDKKTEDWWAKQPLHSRAALKVEPVFDPPTAMLMFVEWLKNSLGPERIPYHNLEGEEQELLEPINMVFYPTYFDYRFISHYVGRYVEHHDLHEFWFRYEGTTAVDIQTMAATLLGVEYHQARRRHWPAGWRAGEKHLQMHNALDDARIQLSYFMIMRREAMDMRAAAEMGSNEGMKE